MTKKSNICCMCNKPYEGYGNNAEPIRSGICCDDCNEIIIMERLKDLINKGGLE